MKNIRPSGANANAVAKLALMVPAGGACGGTTQLFGAGEVVGSPVASGVFRGAGAAPGVAPPIVLGLGVVDAGVDVAPVVSGDAGSGAAEVDPAGRRATTVRLPAPVHAGTKATVTTATRARRRPVIVLSVPYSSALVRAAVTSHGTPMSQTRPFRYQYEPSTALIVVDVQNDFADPTGSLFVTGGEQIPAVATAEVEAALAAGSPVLYTQDWHPPRTPHFQTDGGVWPVHCVAGTWGAELHPDLQVTGPRVQKGKGGEDGYSGFTVRDPLTGECHDTELEGLLRQDEVTTVVILGLATDYCVKETALDAVARGFHAVVPLDGIRAVDLKPGDGQAAIEAMIGAGVRVV